MDPQENSGIVPTKFSLVSRSRTVLKWRASNGMLDCSVFGDMVSESPLLEHACQAKMSCHHSSSKAVGHPLTSCRVESYIIRTSYHDNPSCKSPINALIHSELWQ